MNSIFSGYKPFAGPIAGKNTRSLIAWENGTSSTFGLKNAEERGVLFIGPGVEVYEGMVVGETMREADVTINVCKKKHLTNMRQSIRDIEVRLTPPREMSLDEAIESLTEDELLEITPINFRIRKRILNTEERGKFFKKGSKEVEFVE